MATETLTLAEQTAALRELDGRVAEAKDIYDALKAERDEVEYFLFERMERERCQSFNHEDLDVNFVRAETTYGQIQDRSQFIEWAQEHAPEMLETKERKQQVNELARIHVDDGTPLPPGVGFYVKRYISQRAGRS